jgi:alpha-tubulin suppressor-like RCC1 family protein
VKCWGKNDKGQLGDSSTTDKSSPVFVANIPTATSATATAISAGGSHTCALLSDKTVQCWGENSSGQLGNNSTTNATTPVIVADITTAIAVSTGGSHTCALLSTGVSKCWGANNFGQLGNNVIPISRIAILVPEMTSGITHLGTGASYACASIQDPAVTPKSIQCLGDNEFGQLGNGTENGTNIPVAVSGISTASAVAVGRFHACALLSAPGNIKCWGANDHGKLGNGDTTIISTSTPVDVIGISTATSVSAGNNHTCAVLNDTGAGGSVSCWGDGLSGQRGDGTTTTLA